MNRVFECYRILEVRFGATREDVTSSYKRLCRRYHPDISGIPESEERMKQINLAYAFLRDQWNAEEGARAGAAPGGRTDQSKNTAAAKFVMEAYFAALMSGDYERAYNLISHYDKQYVTLACFCDWRNSVRQVYRMQDYAVAERDGQSSVILKDGRRFPAKKYKVTVTESVRAGGAVQREELIKLAIFEDGFWHVFLGYRDLDTIARSFEDIVRESRRAETARHADDGRDEGVLSAEGFQKQAGHAVYSYRRYGRPFVLAALSVKLPAGHAARSEEVMAVAVRKIRASLRETDLAACDRSGAVLVLFAEMKKRHAAAVTRRLAESVEKEVLLKAGAQVRVDFAFSPYAGRPLKQEVDGLLSKM